MTGSALLNDGNGSIYYFNGVSADAVYRKNLALVMRTSTDNGATWSRPRLINPQRGISSQPIAGAFRTRSGDIVLASDWPWSRKGGGTALWISSDAGEKWSITKSPIAGIHAGVVELKDGRLLALGRSLRRTTAMPQSVSADMGQTWTYSESQFPPIGGGQRLVLMRLSFSPPDRSGRGPLFFASFANKGTPVTIRGACGQKRQAQGLFAALSYDQGRTWSNLHLIMADPPAPPRTGQTMNGREYTLDSNHAEPKGYLACTQTPDGVIHLISSWNHYEFNPGPAGNSQVDLDELQAVAGIGLDAGPDLSGGFVAACR
jgi:sulfatase modifying factor 1